MSRVVVFGAAGKAGSRIVTEAASRGHQVIAVAREGRSLGDLPRGASTVVADVTDQESVSVLAKNADVLVLAVGGPDQKVYTDAVAAVTQAVAALGPDGPRIIHMGGGASLLNEHGVRFYDTDSFPAEYRPYAAGQIAALDSYQGSSGVTWTYLSPPPLHFAPGQRTGTYRTGLDQPVVGADGQARISYEDFAMALVDEIEQPKHLNHRFTVGY
ncbi:NAD(P)-dependent oxidoreductase [Streptomyces sp. GbtcB7]|uniref:NAD(P)-dependent oxidoreductase n=1 Tax=Streptomyces sp. GbtcB7 TaxID=2824752 RepID=UPI001C2F9A51|nr:NAD(P)H-binding protein [Streptomyces sp. GbtcB7]